MYVIADNTTTYQQILNYLTQEKVMITSQLNLPLTYEQEQPKQSINYKDKAILHNNFRNGLESKVLGLRNGNNKVKSRDFNFKILITNRNRLPSNHYNQGYYW